MADFNNPFGNNNNQQGTDVPVNDDALGWDDEVIKKKKKTHIRIKPGTYPFEIARGKRGSFFG